MSGPQKRPFVVLGFGSTHAALDAEETLQSQGMDVVPIPAPASMSANCGIALRIALADAARAEMLLSEADISLVSRSEIEDI